MGLRPSRRPGRARQQISGRAQAAGRRRLIELAWLREIKIAILRATKPEYVIDLAAGQGVPAWFARQHAPDLIAAAKRGLETAHVDELVQLATD